MDPDFEQLSNDVDLIARIKQFRGASDKIAETLKLVDNPELYEKLSNPDKIKYNLLMSFSMNTLFWMYLRTEGIDPASHEIKAENDRLRKSMSRSQEIKDRKTKMPRLDKNVAKRFIRSGLWTPGNSKTTDGSEQINIPEEDWDKPEENQESSAIVTNEENSQPK